MRTITKEQADEAFEALVTMNEVSERRNLSKTEHLARLDREAIVLRYEIEAAQEGLELNQELRRMIEGSDL